MSPETETILQTARLARREQRWPDAKRVLAEGLEHCRRTGTSRDLALMLKALGQIERDLGNTGTALVLYEQAVAIYRSEDQPLEMAHTIRHVGDIQQDSGNYALAEAAYREALAIYRAHPDTAALDLANAVRGLAILTSNASRNDEATLLWQEARELYAKAGVQAGINESSRRLALLGSR